MKIQGTLLIAALALVASAFPALTMQTAKPAETQKTNAKIDSAARTPYMTRQQGANLKKVVAGAEQQKEAEKTALPEPFTPNQPAPATGEQVSGTELAGSPNSAPLQQEAPKPELPKAEYHLMGTVCGNGDDIALFNEGKDWPKILRVGEKVDELTTVEAIEHGVVVLERVTMVMPPMPPAKPAPVVSDPQATEKSAQAPPPPPKPVEKRERFQIYAW